MRKIFLIKQDNRSHVNKTLEMLQEFEISTR